MTPTASMTEDEIKLMVIAHGAGREAYLSGASKADCIEMQQRYPTRNERFAFVAGWSGEQRRKTMGGI